MVTMPRHIVVWGCFTPLIFALCESTSLLGARDIKVGNMGSVFFSYPCLNILVSRFFCLYMLIGIIISSADHDTERIAEHCKHYIVCFKYGVRIPFFWWR